MDNIPCFGLNIGKGSPIFQNTMIKVIQTKIVKCFTYLDLTKISINQIIFTIKCVTHHILYYLHNSIQYKKDLKQLQQKARNTASDTNRKIWN